MSASAVHALYSKMEGNYSEAFRRTLSQRFSFFDSAIYGKDCDRIRNGGIVSPAWPLENWVCKHITGHYSDEGGFELFWKIIVKDQLVTMSKMR